MIGDRIRAELHRPLEGDRRYVREQRGQFTIRMHPEHLAAVMVERARVRVQTDITNYRRFLNAERCRGMTGDL